MTDRPRRPSQTQTRPDDRRALADAYAQAVEHAAHKHDDSARDQTSRWPRTFGLLVFAAVAAYVLIGRPTWVFPAPPTPPTPRIQEAELRAMLYIQARRIIQYRDSLGRLPKTLDDIGTRPLPGVVYVPLDSGKFELEGTDGAARISLRSTDDLKAFLGKSLVTLRNRGVNR